MCISLALSINREPVVGVILNPFNNKLYGGIQGKGSWVQFKKSAGSAWAPATEKDSERISLPLKKNAPLGGISSSLIAVEWGSDRSGPNWDCKYKTFRKLAGDRLDGGSMCHSLRCMGSAALNFCAVAEGGIDCYWEGGCWAWDVAAGWIILKEAGGIVASANKGNWEPTVDGRYYLAVRAAPEGQKELVEEFWSIIEGEYNYKS
jgi:myo-inositol-1(or 4)-monophosphatase